MAIISELIKKAITENKDKLAFKGNSDAEKMTYGEFDEKCAKINALLISKGMKKGDCMAVLLGRNADYLIAQTTGLLYGYKIVLLDQHYPQERIDYSIKDAGVKVVIDEAFIEEAYKCQPDYNVPQLTEDDSTIATYTSGSTGKPKGVLHDQGSLAESVVRSVYMPEHMGSDTAALIAPFTFIAGAWMYLTVLCRGWTVVIIPMDIVKNPRQLAEFIAQHNVSYTYMPPRLLKIFKPVSDSLQMVITGSEKVSGIYSDKFKIVNCYGMTETSATVVTFQLDKMYDNTPCGRPLLNDGAYILDADGKEAEQGEICLTGRFLKEYIGLPEQTAKVKVPNPFKDRDGNEYMYKTGDLGKRLPNGMIQYLNRMDWMIKINGQRIEPGEIEAVMKGVPGVKDAIVKDFSNSRGITYICGFYISEDSVTKEMIHDEIKRKLPEYMLPGFLVRLDAFPVNQNGKLDRFALPDPKTL